MDEFSREFIALCHQGSNAPCMYCGRDYEWHVREGVYEQVAFYSFYLSQLGGCSVFRRWEVKSGFVDLTDPWNQAEDSLDGPSFRSREGIAAT